MYIHLNVCKQMTDVKLLLLHSNTLKPFNCVWQEEKSALIHLRMLSTKWKPNQTNLLLYKSCILIFV